MRADPLPDAFEALAQLYPAEGSMRRALIAWPSRAPAELRPPLARVAARVALGAPLSFALKDLRPVLGEEVEVLTAIVRLHLGSGADPTAPLLAQARRLRADEDLRSRSAAGAAGVRASARLIGGLPLLCLVLFPLERPPLGDPLGVALMAAGLASSAAGFLWIRKALPTGAALGDPVADVCDLMAGALRAGLPPVAALGTAVAVTSGPPRAFFDRALRLARLGSRLPRALQLTGSAELGELGHVIERSIATGAPLAAALEAHACRCRDRAAADAEARLRRAPVRMLPALTLCVLPGFVLLAFGPIVREFLGTL